MVKEAQSFQMSQTRVRRQARRHDLIFSSTLRRTELPPTKKSICCVKVVSVEGLHTVTCSTGSNRAFNCQNT
jgi:hypothetical protein